MKQYIGISRDHSRSMYNLAKTATADYNELISAIRSASTTAGVDTIVSVMECGIGPGPGKNNLCITNSSVQSLSNLSRYETTGGSTPLFDSIDELIKLLNAVPDAKDPNVSFLIQSVTDGQDNASKITGRALGAKIRALQSTDRWTFVFRVPVGYADILSQLGIPRGNIFEWDQSETGMNLSTQATTAAFTHYYNARKSGMRSTQSFYTDIKDIPKSEVKKNLVDVSSNFNMYEVQSDIKVSDFVRVMIGKPLQPGAAFYELTKREKAVQDYKEICIQDKKTKKLYSGYEARSMLGIPRDKTISLNPGDHGGYRIFIQSTSLNRKLIKGTHILYRKSA